MRKMPRPMFIAALVIMLLVGMIADYQDRQQNQKSDQPQSSVIQEQLGLGTLGGQDKRKSFEPTLINDYTGHTFKVRYLDVGQADAALIECDGHSMLIDGGNVADSSLIVSILKSEKINHLDYVINSHPHEDHIGGLVGALNTCTVDHVLCSVTSYNSKAFNSFKKYTEAQGKHIEIPKIGDTFELGSSQVVVLGPTKRYEDYNNNSIILKVIYGQTSFLFTGDVEREGEQGIVDYWTPETIKSTVLKVAHHGSDTSSSYLFIREAAPRYGVISVGSDNTYGHPTEDVLSKLRDAEVEVYRTDQHGDITITSDGNIISIRTEKQGNKAASAGAARDKGENQPLKIDYIGNLKSKVFHLSSCKNLPAEKNRIYFDSRKQALDEGYRPCGNCHP